MFGYEPHEHLLFAYQFFAKPECNRWKSLEKRKKAQRHMADTPSPRPSRRSDSAPLNSAPISTQPATDFHVGISTPEFRRDDATLKYDVTLRQLSLSSCPNPIRAISCLDHHSSSLLKFVSQGLVYIAQVVAVI